VLLPPAAGAQVVDSTQAFGIYRPAPPPADTTPGSPDTTSRAAADSAPARPDSARLLQSVEEAKADTSLTARMDLRRGGGLVRNEFPNLQESATYAGRYSAFLDLLDRDGRGVLTDTTLVTVFAPTDSAFADLPPAELERLLGDSATRTRWVESLVIPGDHGLAELVEGGEVTSRGGTVIRMSMGADSLGRAGSARVVQPNVQARNGILHGVDRVTLPDSGATTATSAAPSQ
jgi:uncharacterized surface protein with fasciclin (FAS1) repeats